MRIHWNGFLKNAVEAYPNEACGFLCSNAPYGGQSEEWFVFQAINTSDTPEKAWTTTSKEVARIRKMAKSQKLSKIGNIHTHPHHEGADIENEKLPSDIDLSFAKKYNDTVRGILVVGKNAIYQSYLHDQFGSEIPITLEEVSE